MSELRVRRGGGSITSTPGSRQNRNWGVLRPTLVAQTIPSSDNVNGSKHCLLAMAPFTNKSRSCEVRV